MAEWELFELIIYQLVNNAVKYSNPGNCITVSALIIFNEDQSLLKTTIVDSGEGIVQDKLEDINRALEEKVKTEIPLNPMNHQDSQVLGFGL